VLWSTEATLVSGQKEWRLPKQEKQSSRFCLAQAVLSQLLILKCCNVLIALFASINSSQPDNWRSVFYSGKDVFVTLFEIFDIGKFARSGSHESSPLNKKPSEKPFLLIFYTISAGERLTYPRLLTADKNWLHYFCTSDKIVTAEILLPSISHKERIQKFCSSGRAQITVLWYCEELIIVNEISSWEKVNSTTWFRSLKK